MRDYYKEQWLDKLEEKPCIYNLNYSMLMKYEDKFVIYIKKENLPIPTYQGDIIRSNDIDYKLVNFNEEQLSDYIGLIVRKINLISHPEEYEKRKTI